MVLDPLSSLYARPTTTTFQPRGAGPTTRAPVTPNKPRPRDAPCRNSPGVRLPLQVRDALLPRSPLARSIIEYFTGVAGWLTAVSQDQCDGQGGQESFNATLTFFGRSAGTILGSSSAAALALAGIASGSAPFLLGGLVIAGGVLVASPSLGERGVKLLSRLGAIALSK